MSFERINSFGKERKPFLFISDFKAQNIDVIPLEDLEKEKIAFSIDENYRYKEHTHFLKKKPIRFEKYREKFNAIIEEIKSGNSYILNLTQETPIQTSLNLKEIYHLANAHYKLCYKDKFVCFSPEKFIQIENDTIHTFPMKGTIDASLVDAEKKILEDVKEMAEHVMIVDLLRNDLSIVAKDVKVEKFRYITEIEAGEKKLLQVSSHISGTLEKNWHSNLGNILKALLPAGSISGAPKRSTLDILQRVEEYERGHFSGVFGFYDGKTFDSGVMIRFIEKTSNGFIYKSGGGITLDSDVTLEYNELQDKIYLP
jgi:para-aminobenzoate synthetase component 1